MRLLLGTSWLSRQSDEPDRDQLGVSTKERNCKMILDSGWDQKTLSHRGLWRLGLGKAGERTMLSERGYPLPQPASFRRMTDRRP